ncbi:flagellar filament capping protein FliD [Sphingomonas naphthae]|uniref:Flagellar hook-associated protein 2 n=1 Tax=Sphingomonas naphthae TaxID=1813468 RepID=A0ABY7TJM7_9SPHN|nr:flagellar filament capping protein FliD [Sphingomonas naphthae]WCT72912.1 flagellar filament capping protein FliD [Sphingomonas naphthae]
MTSIASTLGIGSGIDTKSLIDQLATAAKDPKEKVIAARETANTAKVSALATVSNGITNFSTALNSLISGGTLRTQPTVSDTSVLGATAQAGARIGDLSANLVVTKLATAQSIVSSPAAAATTAIGQGDMTLTVGTTNYTITVGDTNDSLTGLANAINAKNSGVTASIITDANGARLMLKGQTGADNAFTLTPADGAADGLKAFAYPAGADAGMTLAQSAGDAALKLDGVTVTRPSNTIEDLIPGVTLNLKNVSGSSGVSLGSTRPTEAITQAVNDFVAAFNELNTMLTTQTAAAGTSTDAGALRGESAIRDMQRQLSRLTSTVLNSGSGPKTLAEIGVSTNRDGSLTVDASRLTSVMTSDPQGVEAMFNPGQYASDPLIQIASPMGRTKPGTYTVTNATAQTGTTSASGSIAGMSAVTTGGTLVASIASKASGLTIRLLGNVSSATITVDQGLAGALQSISDTLLGTSGALASTKTRLATEAKAIATDRTRMTDLDTSYRARLTTSFTAMDSRVARYKSTQSFLEQQVKVWTNSDN